MLKFIEKLQQELNETGLMPVFEFKVIDTRTRETDYILCEVFFQRKSIIVHRDGLTLSEQGSKFIASDSIVAFKGDSLDSLLEALHEQVMYSIIESPLYDLVE